MSNLKGQIYAIDRHPACVRKLLSACILPHSPALSRSPQLPQATAFPIRSTYFVQVDSTSFPVAPIPMKPFSLVFCAPSELFPFLRCYLNAYDPTCYPVRSMMAWLYGPAYGIICLDCVSAKEGEAGCMVSQLRPAFSALRHGIERLV